MVRTIVHTSYHRTTNKAVNDPPGTKHKLGVSILKNCLVFRRPDNSHYSALSQEIM